ncbi:MAG: RDD family protein [Dysgonamonadaceae bacterium]|jgi:uncharacterized RDD family membrane protein YckC|nr:RDD family protein [Dysgonamonadaceae bacterium]
MSRLYITTTQNVPLFFTPASVGERMLGYLADMIIKFSYLVSMYYLLKYTGVKNIVDTWDTWSAMAFVFVVLIPVIFYSLACESLMEGRTFGKMLMKTRVVKIDGYQASPADYFIRWIFRLIDMDAGYIAGLLSMLLSKHTQRLGDMAAGTAVITEKSKYNISHTILMDVGKDYQPAFSRAQILRFSDNDMRIVKENMMDALKNSDAHLMSRLCAKIESVMQTENPLPSQQEYIAKVIEDYNYYTGE